MDFCTLGMFIIDEIELTPGSAPLTNVPGGAGTWSAIGARIMSPPPASRRVGWIVDAGSDFSGALRAEISAWQTGAVVRETPGRLTTRGWNGYAGNEERAFKYTTPKLRLDASSLTAELLASATFHLICSPARAKDLAETITARRDAELHEQSLQRPIFIWEPVPDLCRPDELEACYEALKVVDVVSPNHSELCAFFGCDGNKSASEVDRTAVEECSEAWLRSGVGKEGRGAVVVRSGKEGCFIRSKAERKWVPAYHQSSTHVKDPTGGGNAFLGGFAVGLVRGTESDRPLESAALWGSVAASFAIEQVGMPKLTTADHGRESWNGGNAQERLAALRQRTS